MTSWRVRDLWGFEESRHGYSLLVLFLFSCHCSVYSLFFRVSIGALLTCFHYRCHQYCVLSCFLLSAESYFNLNNWCAVGSYFPSLLQCCTIQSMAYVSYLRVSMYHCANFYLCLNKKLLLELFLRCCRRPTISTLHTDINRTRSFVSESLCGGIRPIRLLLLSSYCSSMNGKISKVTLLTSIRYSNLSSLLAGNMPFLHILLVFS